MSGAGRFTASNVTRGGSAASASDPAAGAGRTRPRYATPGRALAVAAVGFVLSALAAMWPPSLAGWPSAARAAAVVVLTMAPLALAVVLTRRHARRGETAPGGSARWSWGDLAVGAFAGLGLRAVVELIAQTSAQASGLLASTEALAVTLVSAVVIAPIVEEAFFRGLVLGAVTDALSGAIGRTASAVAAIAVSTAAFVALHAIAAGPSPGLLLAATLTGVGCGALAVVTGRIGAPVAAHVVFNGVGAVLLLV